MSSSISPVPPKKKSWPFASKLFLLLLPLLVIATCRPITLSLGTSGFVYDTTNGAPLEGAVVVAAWYLTGPEGAHVATLAVDEAVTAADGSFEIDGWGPSFKPYLFASLPAEMPKLFIIKAGYLPTTVENFGSGPPFRFHGPLTPASRTLDEKVIPLEQFSGTLVEYLPYLNDVNFRMQLLTVPRCAWKKTPKFILALDAVAQTATRRGLEGGAVLAKMNIPPKDCGTIAEFFDVVDDGLVPCENRMQCVETVRSYDGPPENFLLPVPPWISMRNDGIVNNVVLDAIQEKGWELDGFDVRYGYRIYRVKQRQMM